ncbi:hypothetical protein MUK42_35532, partial [Musa troglodytarum]
MTAFESETPTRNQKTSAFHSQCFPCGQLTLLWESMMFDFDFGVHEEKSIGKDGLGDSYPFFLIFLGVDQIIHHHHLL